MGPAWLCAQSGLRQKVGASFALVVLAGVAGAVVLAAVAGAHRSDTAFDRFMNTARGPDAIYQPQSDEELEQISALPEVSAVAPLWFMAVAPHGLTPGADSGAFAGSDERFGYRINRPVVLHERLADPTRADEVTMNAVIAGHPFTIVGYGLIPVLGDVDASKTAVFTPAGLRAAGGQIEDFHLWFDDRSPHHEATTWADANVAPTAPPAPPPVVRNLADIDRMPLLLALFVGFLAVAALIHATVTTVRWRRRDLAVLRVVGFSGRQLRSTVRWQAWVPVLVGLLVGVPVGIALGRWVWVLVARGPGVQDDAASPVAALAALVPAALLFGALVAALPGRSAARLRPAVALRAE